MSLQSTFSVGNRRPQFSVSETLWGYIQGWSIPVAWQRLDVMQNSQMVRCKIPIFWCCCSWYWWPGTVAAQGARSSNVLAAGQLEIVWFIDAYISCCMNFYDQKQSIRWWWITVVPNYTKGVFLKWRKWKLLCPSLKTPDKYLFKDFTFIFGLFLFLLPCWHIRKS